MAEITQTHQNKAAGKVRTTKRSTKIDMTPMVDLAFLLLTFFILTAAFKKSRALPLTMPEKTGHVSLMPAKDILNLVLAENDRIYWWVGLDPPAEVTNYSKNGVRKILLEIRKSNPEFMVLIKPADESRYQNIVDILDEMKITDMQRYAIVDLTQDDRTIMTGAGEAGHEATAP